MQLVLEEPHRFIKMLLKLKVSLPSLFILFLQSKHNLRACITLVCVKWSKLCGKNPNYGQFFPHIEARQNTVERGEEKDGFKSTCQ